ncbi:MAG: hypothetical protein ACRBN8_14815 [Nannocystales bacterium]
MGLVVKLVIFAIVGIAGAVAARRMAIAAKAPISDDECVSCGSSEVQVQGAGAYVCLACGYEGGSGRAALHEQAQAERYANLSPQARQEAVTDHIRTAARILSNYNEGVVVGNVGLAAVGLDEFSRDEGLAAARSTVAGDLCAAAAELKLAARVAGGEIVLANGLTVDAKGVAKSLLEAQEKMLASVAMISTAANADSYLQKVLAGIPDVSAASNPSA